MASFQAFPSCGDETLSIGAMYLALADRGGGDEIEPMSDYHLGDLDQRGVRQAGALECFEDLVHVGVLRPLEEMRPAGKPLDQRFRCELLDGDPEVLGVGGRVRVLPSLMT